MQVGVNSFIWESPFRTDVFHLIDRIENFNADVIEIAIEDPTLIDLSKLKEKLELTSLDVSICGAFGPNRDLASEDSEKRQNSMQYARTCIDYARELDANILCGPMYSAVGVTHSRDESDRQAQWERAVQGVRELGNYAHQNDVTLAVEPLNRFETDILNTSTQLEQFLTDVNHPAVKGHLDTFHMNIEDKSFKEGIEMIGDDLVHFHTCENDRGTPGSGNIDWNEIFEALDGINYDGYLVIESFTPDVEEISKAAAIWRPLEKDQDTLAEKGLTFLRKHFSSRN